jgi:hypothetical protein
MVNNWNNNRYLVGGLESYFSIQLGMSSSQLTITPSFFRGVGIPTTNQYKMNKVLVPSEM